MIATLTFFFMHLMPGSPFQNMEHLSEEQLELLNEKFRLNDPLAVQYGRYLANLIQGDLGVSFQYNGKPVTEIISERIGPSAQIGAQALVLGTVVGIFLGVIAAIRHHTFWDYGTMAITVLGISIPSFVFAGILQYFVGVKLQWFPVALWGSFEHTILPTISLSVSVIAVIARFMRAEMIEVLSQDYMITAQAKGMGKTKIIVRHALRNALIPIITIIGPITVNLLTGTLVIEKIFSVPGIGEQFVTSIMNNDYPVIMGLTLFYSVLFIAAVLISDLLYGLIDPRIRLTEGGDKS